MIGNHRLRIGAAIGASGARLTAVPGVLDPQPETPAITHSRLDLLTQVADAQHDLLDTLAAQQGELMKNERPPGNRQQ